MPYDVHLRDLYNNCLGEWAARRGDKENPAVKAAAWIDALNVRAAWRLVDQWFLYLQAGTADDHLPDPFWHCPEGRKPLSPEVADELVAEIDADIQIEVTRLNHTDHDLVGSGFHRLSPSARLAFAQQYYDTIKLEPELWAEAVQRREAGEVLPPPEGDPQWQER